MKSISIEHVKRMASQTGPYQSAAKLALSWATAAGYKRITRERWIDAVWPDAPELDAENVAMLVPEELR